MNPLLGFLFCASSVAFVVSPPLQFFDHIATVVLKGSFAYGLSLFGSLPLFPYFLIQSVFEDQQGILYLLTAFGGGVLVLFGLLGTSLALFVPARGPAPFDLRLNYAIQYLQTM